MFSETYAEDLEKEIILMEQELIFKRSLLNEFREKLDSEVSEHAETKLTAAKYLNENKELQMQLDVCLTGTQKLEEENKKNRELLVKLQVELNAYLNERPQLLDSCYQSEKENSTLKNEMAELKEQLKGHLVFLENFKLRKSKTEAFITEILAKQEILNKEQIRLESACKESMRFTEKLSEEAKFQHKFVQEAKIGHAKMENEIIRLMVPNESAVFVREIPDKFDEFAKVWEKAHKNKTALDELIIERENSKNEALHSENSNYLELWKAHQIEMKARNEELQEINKRLQEELAFAKDQIEMLIKNY